MSFPNYWNEQYHYIKCIGFLHMGGLYWRKCIMEVCTCISPITIKKWSFCSTWIIIQFYQDSTKIVKIKINFIPWKLHMCGWMDKFINVLLVKLYSMPHTFIKVFPVKVLCYTVTVYTYSTLIIIVMPTITGNWKRQWKERDTLLQNGTLPQVFKVWWVHMAASYRST